MYPISNELFAKCSFHGIQTSKDGGTISSERGWVPVRLSLFLRAHTRYSCPKTCTLKLTVAEMQRKFDQHHPILSGMFYVNVIVGRWVRSLIIAIREGGKVGSGCSTPEELTLRYLR